MAITSLQGCSADTAPPSDDVGNANIYAKFSAISAGNGSVEVKAELSEGAGGRYLRLNGDDQLLASNGKPIDTALSLDGNLFGGTVDVSNTILPLQERDRIDWNLLFFIEVFGDPEYFTQYTNPDGTLPFYISFLRTVDRSIHNAAIHLPPPFEISAPQSLVSIPRNQTIQLTWSPSNSGYEMQLDMAAVCGGTRFRNSKILVGDSGSEPVTTTDIFGTAMPWVNNCSVALALRRTRYSPVPTLYGGGEAVGVEKRVVNFVSTP